MIDPNRAITEVENFLLATSQIAQTTLRSVLGKAELDDLLSERERLNAGASDDHRRADRALGREGHDGRGQGRRAAAEQMQRAMARQAEAERERRAKIIAAEGEFQAAEKLAEAADIISQQPGDAPAPLPADAARDGRQPEHDDRLPDPDRSDQALPRSRCAVERRSRGDGRGRRFRRRRDTDPPGLSSPEIRIDQLTGLRTILAPGRASRPEAFAKAARDLTPAGLDGCPFCEGAEEKTPPESWAFRPAGGDADGPGWVARSMPNLYPVLGEAPATLGSDPSPAATTEPAGTSGSDPHATTPTRAPLETGLSASIDPLRASTRATEPNLFASTPAEGAHEVLVNAPEHVVSMAELSEERFGTAVSFWRERMRAFADESAYLHLIVNEGVAAGASREHTHAQLYALRFVPAEIARERERMKAYYERTMGGDLLVDVITEEIRRRERVVAVDDEAILICPYASRSPFEMRIVPRASSPSFETDGDAGTAMIRRAIDGLAKLFGRAAVQPLGTDRAPRRRPLPLARRHRPQAHRARRVRARHRHADQRLPARARCRRPARGDRVGMDLAVLEGAFALTRLDRDADPPPLPDGPLAALIRDPHALTLVAPEGSAPEGAEESRGLACARGRRPARPLADRRPGEPRRPAPRGRRPALRRLELRHRLRSRSRRPPGRSDDGTGGRGPLRELGRGSDPFPNGVPDPLPG